MLYYHDRPQRVRLTFLTALENQNLIPTVKFGKPSITVWGSISSEFDDTIKVLNEIMAKEVYLDILKNELITLRNLVLLNWLIRINSITNTIEAMILNINLIYVSPSYHTTLSKLLILLPKVLILTLLKCSSCTDQLPTLPNNFDSTGTAFTRGITTGR